MARSDVLNIPEGVVVLAYPDNFSKESYLEIAEWLAFEANKLRRWATNSLKNDLSEVISEDITQEGENGR